jgi:hypothetical protein
MCPPSWRTKKESLSWLLRLLAKIKNGGFAVRIAGDRDGRPYKDIADCVVGEPHVFARNTDCETSLSSP